MENFGNNMSMPSDISPMPLMLGQKVLPAEYEDSLSPIEKINNFGMGSDKLGLWKNLALQLSIAGHNPFENKIKLIRYIDSETLKVVTEEDGVYEIKYKYLYIFDDHAFDGLPPHTGVTTTKQMYVDYLKIKNTWSWSREPLLREDSFINQVYWETKAPRVEDLHRKYLVVVSYADSEQGIQPEYLVKIKLAKILEERAGREVILEHELREVTPLGQNVYDDFDHAAFVYADADHIYKWHDPRFRMDYMKYFRVMMGIKL